MLHITTTFLKNDNGKYFYPKGSTITKVTCNNKEMQEDEYSINLEEYSISILVDHNSITIEHDNIKEKIIGFTDKHIFRYSGNSLLETSSKYVIESKYKDIEFETKLSPMLCKEGDIRRLIGTVIDNVDIDIERYIYETSIDLSKNKDIADTDKARICKNKVALDIIYQYYYVLIENTGTNEDSIGTLKIKRQRVAIKLDDLIKRFEEGVNDSSSIITSKSFTKAKQTTSPIGGRLW